MEYLLDEDNGVILDKVTRDRCLILTKARLAQLFSMLPGVFGENTRGILLEAFKSAGERYVSEVTDSKKADADQFLGISVQRFIDAGLGKIELIDFDPDLNKAQFRIRNNFFSELYNSEETFCDCVGAFVVGMYKGYFNETVQIEEVKCVSKGDLYCEWCLTPKK
ncbi:MAG: hypothetical protein NWF00_13035 [Candidatus Bathyarchaeota archaeon]|nr:hypothetical protein [Candidatus Bathyarchaeota archaeon]